MSMECPSCAAPIDVGADACLACGRSLSTLALGSILASRYELRSVLGKGTMGLVYRAFDKLLEEEVAIKVLRTDLSSSADAVRRFRSEIKLARKVSHPNVCRIHDYGEEGPLGYISMEILTGQDLSKTLSEQPDGLPEEEAVSAVLQIAAGLQAIHDVGILHRDLKTANASRDDRGVVRLVDFGIAKDLLSEGQTVEGQSFGTPEYMSPEHCRGEKLDFRSDVYALGIVAFELFTGDVPITRSSPMATLLKQIHDVASFETEPGSRVPRRFVPVLRRALAKSAADRFASAQEFATALRQAAMAPPAPSPPPAAVVDRTKAPGFKDERRHERILLPTDILLLKLGPGGRSEKEERTVAHDLSRAGMRILSSWSDLEKGDRVAIAEVAGDFSTGAIVRHVKRGVDQITRVGIEFVGRVAPDRLVGTDPTQRFPATPDKPPPPVDGAKNSRPRPRRSSGSHLREAVSNLSVAMPPPIAGRGSSSHSPSGPNPLAFPSHHAASIQEEVEKAQRLGSESRTTEALDCLARAREMAEGTPEATRIQILIAETQAKNPAWLKAAQQNLEDLARAQPGYLPVHLALGRIFRGAGLIVRARASFARALALDPSDREATDALAALATSPVRRSSS